MENKKRKIMITVIAILLVLGVLGASYAFFNAALGGQETTETITVAGGSMDVTFNGGNSIAVSNVIPDNNPAASKNFTVVGNNTTAGLTIPYQISLVVDENTFTSNAIYYTLASTNTSDSGVVAPSIMAQTGLPTSSGIYALGSGEFTSGTGKVHTYTLNIYFPDTGTDQNVDQGKTFKAHISIDDNPTVALDCDECLNTKILAQGGGTAMIESKGNPDFSEISTTADSGLYAASDDYGTSYYYRGNRDLLNNNVIFAGYQWKIVRVNGDRSVRLIYNGECGVDDCPINTTGIDTQIDEQAWSQYSDDNKYVGYMYGGADGAASTSRPQAVTNTNSSNAKAKLDDWYENNLAMLLMSVNKISDNIFCNDREIASSAAHNTYFGDPTVGTGFGDSITAYKTAERLTQASNPTLKCTDKNDRFTVSDTTKGNGALTYPIGLLTADEAYLAGLIDSIPNADNYLASGQYFWTFSPIDFGGDAGGWIVDLPGYLSSSGIDSAAGLRPVINLKADVVVIGDGSTDAPFEVTV